VSGHISQLLQLTITNMACRPKLSFFRFVNGNLPIRLGPKTCYQLFCGVAKISAQANLLWRLTALARARHFEQAFDALGGKIIKQFEKGDRSEKDDQPGEGAGKGERKIHVGSRDSEIQF
jgi:hypothetical protein